jgi:hypothetical protein
VDCRPVGVAFVTEFSIRARDGREIMVADDEGGAILALRVHLREGGAADFPLTVLQHAPPHQGVYEIKALFWGRARLTPQHTITLELPMMRGD